MAETNKERKNTSSNLARILLIEDDQFVRDLWEDLLKEQGYVVFSLPDPRKIYDILEKEKIDLIISGIMQPYKDGFEVLEELKRSKKYRDIPCIFCSGIGGTKEVKARALKLGAELCLDKAKVTPDVFVAKINEFVESLIKKKSEKEISPTPEEEKSQALKMKCSSCSKEIPDTLKFCWFCGKSVEQEQPENNLEKEGLKEKKPIDLKYAGFWIRLIASITDIAVILLFLGLLLRVGLEWPVKADVLVGCFSLVAYQLFFLSVYSSTPGKMLYGLKIVDAESKEKASSKKMLSRVLSYFLSFLLLGSGFLSIGWDNKKQGLHDRIAKTFVLRKKRKKLILLIVFTIILIVASAGFFPWQMFFSGYLDYLNYVLEGEYFYLPEQSREKLEESERTLLKQPKNFQSLLSTAKPNDPDYRIKASENNEKSTPREIIEKYGDAVVLVKTDKTFGSGFIIHPDGIVVTNYHVIEDASQVVVTLTEKEIYPVVAVVDYGKTDYPAYEDIVLLKIGAENLPTVSIGDSDKLNIGEEIVVVGNPTGVDNTISKGIISSAEREFDGTNYIQIDAPTSGGSSGGPIINQEGEVVAVLTLGWPEDLNFGLPINTIFDLELGNIYRE